MSLPCDERVVKTHNKISFFFDTFVIITTQPLSSDVSLSFCNFGLFSRVGSCGDVSKFDRCDRVSCLEIPAVKFRSDCWI